MFWRIFPTNIKVLRAVGSTGTEGLSDKHTQTVHELHSFWRDDGRDQESQEVKPSHHGVLGTRELGRRFFLKKVAKVPHHAAKSPQKNEHLTLGRWKPSR